MTLSTACTNKAHGHCWGDVYDRNQHRSLPCECPCHQTSQKDIA